MESFYSILYYKTNPMLDEHVAIAIFLGGGEGPWLHISSKRMKLLENLLHRNTFLTIRRNIKALKEKVDNYRETKPDLLLFDPHYSKEQLQELAHQLKGALIYAEPTVVNDWMDERLKNEMVKTVLGEAVMPKVKRSAPFSLLWKTFCNSKRFVEYKKNFPLNLLNAESLASIELHLLEEINKTIIQGISFDVKKETVRLKLRELTIIQNDSKGYTINVVYPKPKTKQGLSLLDSALKNMEGFNFIDFTAFKKQVK
jgi:hypothetical protein